MKNKRWILDEKTATLIPAQDYEKPEHHFVMEDTKDYLSPTTYDQSRGHMKLVSGRRQRREDLKVNDCREVDPGERQNMMKWKDRNEKLPEILQGDNFERSVYQAEQRQRTGRR
jgi:hypothetical protein